MAEETEREREREREEEIKRMAGGRRKGRRKETQESTSEYMKNRQKGGGSFSFPQAHEQIRLGYTTLQQYTEEPISDFSHGSRRTHQNAVAGSE